MSGMEGRFVILQHVGCGRSHYDLMLERGDSLATWQVDVPPQKWAQQGQVSCRRLADHRLAYLDDEGAVSGGRGSVSAVDRGTFVSGGWAELSIAVQILGRSLHGTLELRAETDAEGQWRLTYRPDRL